MHKLTNYLLFLFFVSLLVFTNACQKEDINPRTKEMETAELDSLLRSLEAKGIDIDTTSMSVYYFVREAGEGEYPKAGDNCYVSYVGFLPNGKKIEDSRDIYPPNGIWPVKFKPDHKVIGLNNAIGYMNKGMEIEMYITSDLAYGSKGTALVPPFTTVIYRATMHDLQPAD